MGEETTDHAMAAMRTMRDNLSEEERSGNVGKIVSYIIDLCQGGWTFRQAQRNVGELSTLGQHLETVEKKLEELANGGKEAILNALEYQKKNITKPMKEYYCDNFSLDVHELYENVAHDKITEHEKTKQLIIKSLKSFQKERSNELITNMVKGSALVAAFQAVKVFLAWKTISNASNVLMENPNDFSAINRNIERMENMVAEFLELCETNPTDGRISRRMMRINTLFTSTLGKISTLRVKIDGHIQRLDLVADYSVIDGVVNAITAVSHGVQVWHTWSNLTSLTAALGVSMTAVFAGLAAANFRQAYLSQNTLKDLRRDLREVIRLQDTLQDLHDQAAEALSLIPD